MAATLEARLVKIKDKIGGQTEASLNSQIKGLESKAAAYTKIGIPTLPGVPDLGKMMEKKLKSEAETILDKARPLVTNLLITLFTVETAKAMIERAPELNKIISSCNSVIDMIAVAIAILTASAAIIFSIILVLNIIKTVAGIIGMIPSPTVGMMVGVAFDMGKFIASKTTDACTAILVKLKPIAYKIVAILNMILRIFGFFKMIMGLIQMFSKQQSDASSSATTAFSNTADDWANLTDDDVLVNIDVSKFDPKFDLIECTLPSNEVKQMTPEDCLIAGGIFSDMDLISDYNKCILRLRDCENNISDKDRCVKIKMECDAACEKLGNLCELQLDENIITSLIHGHSDVTIEKATQQTGKRIGFYQSDIKK